MPLDQQFTFVAELVRNWKNKPEDSENLALYSLYKQALFGDVNIEQPSDEVEAAKWQAWSDRKGLTQDEAKEKYIELAAEIGPKYAV